MYPFNACAKLESIYPSASSNALLLQNITVPVAVMICASVALLERSRLMEKGWREGGR